MRASWLRVLDWLARKSDSRLRLTADGAILWPQGSAGDERRTAAALLPEPLRAQAGALAAAMDGWLREAPAPGQGVVLLGVAGDRLLVYGNAVSRAHAAEMLQKVMAGEQELDAPWQPAWEENLAYLLEQPQTIGTAHYDSVVDALFEFGRFVPVVIEPGVSDAARDVKVLWDGTRAEALQRVCDEQGLTYRKVHGVLVIGPKGD
jgi:hypothetical protein